MPSDDFFRAHSGEIDSLTQKFQGFPDVNRTKIELWIQNFRDEHKELALKLLNNVDYFDTARIYTACRDIFTQLKTLKGEDLSNVYFCNFGNPANSGQHILSIFAMANGLTGRANTPKFKQISELNELLLKPDITILFLDDFIGTGNQALNYWSGIASLVSSNAEIFLGAICAFEEGIVNIQNNTEMKVLCHKRLNNTHKLLSTENNIFTSAEKVILQSYCNSTGAHLPQGYGNCQAIVVLSYRTPNNTVSILTVQTDTWRGIFPRYSNNL